jgi:hypothetical protein
MRYRRPVSHDPYWITARFASQCHNCKESIARGARAFYYPGSKTILCSRPNCGQDAARDFSSAAQDETFMSSQFGAY